MLFCYDKMELTFRTYFVILISVFYGGIYAITDLEGLSPDIKTVMEDAKNEKFDRFLCYSLREISDNAELQTVIAIFIYTT